LAGVGQRWREKLERAMGIEPKGKALKVFEISSLMQMLVPSVISV
jgi:hypothetical protein